MIALIVDALLLAQSVIPQQAYILDHPIDPDLRIIATSDGRYPFALLSGDDCSWVHSDMNVTVSTTQGSMWRISDGAAGCNVVVSDMVDATPCYANDDGACDIDAPGEHYQGD